MADQTDLQKLVVTLEARTTAFEKSMAKANATAQRQTRAIEKRFAAMNRTVAATSSKMGGGITAGLGMIGKLGGALGIGLSLQAIVQGIQEITSAADDLVDTAKRLGILPSQLELFRRAAEIGGASAGELDAGLKKLQVNWVTAATKGGKFADFLTQVGVNMKNADGTLPSLNEQMEIMSDIFGRIDDEATRAAVATLAFGRAGAGLGEAFHDDAVAQAREEFERFGQTTDAQKEKLAAAHETIQTFWTAFKTQAALATAEGITALQSFGGQVDDLGASINRFIANPNVETFFDLLFGKGAAEAAGITKPIKDANDLIDRNKQKIEELTAKIKHEEQAIIDIRARMKELGMPFDSSGMEQTIARMRAEIAELNGVINNTISSIGTLESMRMQADDYVEYLTRRGQGYDPIPGPPKVDTRYIPTSPTYQTMPPAVVKPKIEIDAGDLEDLEDGVEKAAEKAASKLEGTLTDHVTAAIGAWETRGMSLAEAYRARGGAGEYGRYQIMPYNVTAWSKELYGYPVSHERFLATPDIQDEIARFKIGQYMDRYYKTYGVEGVARAWNTGSPTGRATAGYVEGVMGKLSAGAGFDDMREGMNDTSDAMQGMIDKFAELRSMSEDFLNTFVDGLLEGKSAVEALGDALEELGRSLIKSGIHMLVGSIFPNIPAGGGATLLQHGGPMWPGNAYKVHKDEVVMPRSPMQVIPASRVGGGDGGYALTYAPSIVIQGNADENAIRIMRDRVMIDIEQRLPAMFRKANRDRRL